MKFDIVIEPENGHFVAQVVGIPFLRAEGANHDAAKSALLTSLRQRMKQGSLFSVDVEPDFEPNTDSKTGPKPVFYDFKPKNIRELAGIFKDDPDLDEIREEIYRARDEEKRREFGE